MPNPYELFTSLIADDNPYSGIDAENYMYFAADEVQRRQAMSGGRLTAGQQIAIQDTFKQLAGVQPTHYAVDKETGTAQPRDMLAEQIAIANRADPYKNFMRSYQHGVMQAGANIVGAFDPARGAKQRRRWQLENMPQEGVSRTLGEIGATATSMIPLLNPVTAPVGLAAYGAGGAGGVRADVHERRQQGQEISAYDEWAGALSTGAIEVISGYVGGRIAQGMGRVFAAQAPAIAQAFQVGGMGAAKEATRSIFRAGARYIGAAIPAGIAEGTEEALTQLTENLIAQYTYAPDQQLTAGVGEAFKGGAVMPLVMGPLAHGMGRVGGRGVTQTPAEIAGTEEAAPEAPTASAEQILTEFVQSDAEQPHKEMVVAQLDSLANTRQEITPELVAGLIEGTRPEPSTEAPAEPTAATPSPLRGEGVAGPQVPEGRPDTGAYAKMPFERVLQDAANNVQRAKEELAWRQEQGITEPEPSPAAGTAPVTTPKVSEVEVDPTEAPAAKLSDQAVTNLKTLQKATGKIESVEPATPLESQAQEFARDRDVEVVYVTGKGAKKFQGATVGGTVFVKSGMGTSAVAQTIGHEISHTKGLDDKLKLTMKERTLIRRYAQKYLNMLPEGDLKQDLMDNPKKLQKEALALLIGEIVGDPRVRNRIAKSQNASMLEKLGEIIKTWYKKVSGKYTVVDEVVREFTEGLAAPEKMPKAARKKIASMQERITELEVDELSQLGVKRILNEDWERMSKEAKAKKQPLSVAIFDVTNFKEINDNLGHEAGDEAIRKIGEAIKENIRGERGDISGAAHRPGGDEFSVLLPNVSGMEARAAMKRIEDAITAKLKEAGLDQVETPKGKATVRALGGVATLQPGQDADLKEIMEIADKRGYGRKAAAKKVWAKKGEVTEREVKRAEEVTPTTEPEGEEARAEREEEEGLRVRDVGKGEKGPEKLTEEQKKERKRERDKAARKKKTEEAKEKKRLAYLEFKPIQTSAETNKLFDLALHNKLPEAKQKELQSLEVQSELVDIIQSDVQGPEAAKLKANAKTLVIAGQMGMLRGMANKWGRDDAALRDDVMAEGQRSITTFFGGKQLRNLKLKREGQLTGVLKRQVESSIKTMILGPKAKGKGGVYTKAQMRALGEAEEALPATPQEEKKQAGPRDYEDLVQESRDIAIAEKRKQAAEALKSDEGKQAQAANVVEQLASMKAMGMTDVEMAEAVSENTGLDITEQTIENLREGARELGIQFLPDPEVTKTETFKKNFGKSLIRSKDKPRIVFHGTPEGELGQFYYVSHFGTLQAATEVMERHTAEREGYYEFRRKNAIYPVYLRIENPVVVRDVEANDEDSFLKAMQEKGYINANQSDQIKRKISGVTRGPQWKTVGKQYGHNTVNASIHIALQEINKMTGKNFDGIAYKNRLEDAGSMSYVTLTPDQVLNAYTGEPILSEEDVYLLPDPKEVELFRNMVVDAMQGKPVKTKANKAVPLEGVHERKLHRVMQLLQEKKGKPVKQTNVEQDKRAVAKLKDPKYKAEVTRKLEEGANFTDADQERAAVQVLQQAGSRAVKTGKLDDYSRALELGVGYDEAGTKAGQILQARIDRRSKPGQRMSEFVYHTATTLPSKLKEKVRKAKDKQEAQVVIDAYSKEVKALMDKWAEQGIDITKLDDEVQRSPKLLWKLTRDIEDLTVQHGRWSPIQEYYRNALMASPLTIQRNILGGLYAMGDIIAVKPTARVLKSIFGASTTGENDAALSAVMSNTARSRAWANMVATFMYEVPAFEKSLRGRAAKHIEIYGPPAITGDKAGSLAAKVFGEGVGDTVKRTVGAAGKVIRLPQRINAAVDQFVKTVHAHSEVAAYAVRNGKGMGLKVGTQEMQDFIDSQLADMASKSWADAIGSGETARVTFTGEGGMVEQAIIDLREKFPPLGLVVPFIKTPMQIAKQAAISSPLGAAYMGTRIAQEALGGKRYDRDVMARQAAQQLFAWLATAMLWGALDDEEDKEPVITGPVSYARKFRRETYLRKEQRPPMSLRIGDTWFSYRNVEPFSSMLGVAISAVDSIKAVEKGAVKTDEAIRAWSKVVSMFSDQTYLRAIGDIYKITNEVDESKLSKWSARIAAGFMPNIVDSWMRAEDKKIRNQKVIGPKGKRVNWVTQVQREAYPTDTVLPPPKVDVFGKDVEAYGNDPDSVFMIRFAWPFIPKEVKQDKKYKVLGMLEKWNQAHPNNQRWMQAPAVTIPMPRTKDTVGLPQEQMTEDEYYKVCRLSGLLSANRIERFDRWNYNNPTAKDIERLREMFSDARSRARGYVIRAHELRARGREDDANLMIKRLDQAILRAEGSN